MRAGLDISRRSVHMVFMVCEPVPLVLEGRTFPRPVEPAVIVDTLRSWEKFYETGPFTIAACSEDPWPDELEATLRRHGHDLYWIDRQILDSTVKTWQSLRPDPRWTRGGIMASLSALRGLISCSDNSSYCTALVWLYASLRSQLQDLEGALFFEGVNLCPDHLNSKCPLCDRGTHSIELPMVHSTREGVRS